MLNWFIGSRMVAMNDGGHWKFREDVFLCGSISIMQFLVRKQARIITEECMISHREVIQTSNAQKLEVFSCLPHHKLCFEGTHIAKLNTQRLTWRLIICRRRN